MTRRWPIRWRLAAVSASLTFVILLVFAFAIGRLAADRLRDDFHDELRTTAGRLAFEIEISRSAGTLPDITAPQLQEVAIANNATVRVVSEDGRVLWPPGAPRLGPPPTPGVSKLDSLRVATAPIFSSAVGVPTTYVQYARSHEALEATIHRLWLFLGGGVLAGTALAALAGFAVARRAMRPISELTATAREIASTGDPSQRIPTPRSEDEVAELARTLEQMLRSLDAARARSEQLVQAQREFVADASHELRTPLTSVLANLELLAASLARPAGADGAEDEGRAETVAAALRSTRRMSRLVSDLLLLARADAGHPAPRRLCDFAEIVQNAVAEVEPVAGARKLGIRAERPLPVEGNPDELHRLTVNLLENSVRHTPEGTTVWVAAFARDGSALLDVSDDGPGLPGGAEQQVFGRFVRGTGPADEAGDGGTGLGLAIVKAVAASHSGEVEAGRSPAGGARFTVRVPLAKTATPAAASRPT